MSGDYPFEWGWHRGSYYLTAAGRLAAKVWSPEWGVWSWRCGPRTGRERSLLTAQLRAEWAWLELTGQLGDDGWPELNDEPEP